MGIDGVGKAEYGEHLESNLKELIVRMKRMGYRPGPGRSCHDAVRDLQHYLYRNPVQKVIDVDLAKFFDGQAILTIDHELLLGMLREKINDPRFLRYVQRMSKSGVLVTGELTVGQEGVPQGSLCSPILANVFAHTVMDVWLEEVVKSHCAGKVAEIACTCQYPRIHTREHNDQKRVNSV